jgi:hypothetical protein
MLFTHSARRRYRALHARVVYTALAMVAFAAHGAFVIVENGGGIHERLRL